MFRKAGLSLVLTAPLVMSQDGWFCFSRYPQMCVNHKTGSGTESQHHHHLLSRTHTHPLHIYRHKYTHACLFPSVARLLSCTCKPSHHLSSSVRVLLQSKGVNLLRLFESSALTGPWSTVVQVSQPFSIHPFVFVNNRIVRQIRF